MALLDLLGRRWSMRVLWELSAAGPLTFRELRERCDGMSPSVLNQRLRELRDAEIISLDGEGYALTEEGRELGWQLAALGAWAKRWAKRLERR